MAKKKAAKKVTPINAVKATAKKTTPKPAGSLKRTLSSAAKKVADKLEKLVTPTGDSIAKSMIGISAPKIKIPSTGGKEVSLSDLGGKRAVLYFYPKDSTPGCTLEGYDFKRLKKEFENENTEIFGVSKDSLKSHENFKNKCGFPFDLLVDEDEKLCKAFDVIQMKSLYGRKYLGIERSTFVVDEKGKVIREWRKVKVNGHAEEVLDFLRTLS